MSDDPKPVDDAAECDSNTRRRSERLRAVRRLAALCRGAHWINIVIRRNGKDEVHEGEWLRDLCLRLVRERDEPTDPTKRYHQICHEQRIVLELERDEAIEARDVARLIYKSAEDSALRNGQERDALKRENADILLKDRIKTREINTLTAEVKQIRRENEELRARAEKAEEHMQEHKDGKWARMGKTYARPAFSVDPEEAE